MTTEPTTGPARRTLLPVAAAVALAAMAPFLRTGGHGFVNLDDYDYALKHREVTGGLSAGAAAWAFTSRAECIWMPLTWISYMADHTFAGGSPRAMHLHSVAVHGLNAALLFLLLTMLAGGGNGRKAGAVAALSALFWAVHPLRCESVAWIASRKDVLSLFWELLAFIFWMRFLPRGWAGAAGRREYALSMGCFVLSSLCKPSCMTFPFLAAILDFFIVQRHKQTPWNWRPYAAPAAYAVVVAAVAQYAQSAGGATADLRDVPVWYRLANACCSYGIYVFHTVWPSELAAPCECRWPRPPRLLVPGLAIAGVACLYMLWRAHRHRKDILGLRPVGDAPFACAIFFSAAVFPFLGISNFGYHAYADRFTYVPSLAFAIGLAAAARHVRENGGKVFNRAFLSLALVAVAALGVAADRQSRVWRDDETLFTNTLVVDGDANFTAHRNLAMYYYEFRHDLQKVIFHFEKAKAIDALHAGDIGLVYIIALLETGETEKLAGELSWFMEWSRGEIEAAEKERKSGEPPVRTTTDLLLACAAYAVAEGDYATAETHLRSVRGVRPDSGFAYYIEGLMKERRGDLDGREEAWSHLGDDGTEPYLRHRWVAMRRRQATPTPEHR